MFEVQWRIISILRLHKRQNNLVNLKVIIPKLMVLKYKYLPQLRASLKSMCLMF